MWVNKQGWERLNDRIEELEKEVRVLKLDRSLGPADLNGGSGSERFAEEWRRAWGLALESGSYREHCCTIKEAIRMILDLLRKELNCEIKFERPSQEPALVAVKKETPEGEEQ